MELQIPAQASASTQNTPAHYLLRNTQIQLFKISASVGTKNKHAGQHITPADVAIPSTGKC